MLLTLLQKFTAHADLMAGTGVDFLCYLKHALLQWVSKQAILKIYSARRGMYDFPRIFLSRVTCK